MALPERGIWAVADGMGGHAAGDIASRAVIDSLLDLEPAADLRKCVRSVRVAMQKVNESLILAAKRRWRQIVGSTVAVLLLSDDRYICLWAGDSRIFLLRNQQLKQLTQDHSQVEEMISKGRITRAQAESMPGSSAITRAVGVMESLELDIVSGKTQEGDTFLLCSDGLYNELPPSEIAQLLSANDPRIAADGLVDRALQGRARDNISVVVVHIGDDQATKTVFNPSAVRQPAPDDDDDQTTINR